MKKRIFSACFVFCSLLPLGAWESDDESTSPMDAVNEEVKREQEANKNRQITERGVSDVISTKPKAKTRVQGNFRGKDPMIPTEGEMRNEPIDGSRPKSK